MTSYLINSKIEACKDYCTAGYGCETRLLAKYEVGEENVEDRGQAAPDVVEGDAHMPEAQIVERDHPHKDDGERKDLKGSVGNWTFLCLLKLPASILRDPLEALEN